MTPPQPPKKTRPATYTGASRMLRMLHGLQERPYGWSVDAILEDLDISERTLARYIAASRDALVDLEGNPLIEVVRHGERRVVRLTSRDATPDATAYQVLFLYFSLAVFQFLEGTVIRDGVEDLWERFRKTLPGPEQRRLGDFDRKFFVVPHAMKDYREHDEHLDVLVRCIVHQHRTRIDYAGLLGDGRVHDFEPYTLAMYRGGLYLIGKSNYGNRIIKLAVERMRSVEKLADTFNYPRDYSPQKHTEGVFGIIEGEETRVELLIHNDETEAYLRSRRIHPTQKFRQRRDGKTVLTMTVRGTEELANWVIGFGPYLEVLSPKSLRSEVADALKAASARYC